MLIVTIATSDVKAVSGPTEIVLKSQKKIFLFKFFIIKKKKNKKTITLKRRSVNKKT